MGMLSSPLLFHRMALTLFISLLSAKASSFRAIASATQTIINILNEIGTHKAFCETFGVTAEELETTAESTATTAYGGYLINIGLQGRC